MEMFCFMGQLKSWQVEIWAKRSILVSFSNYYYIPSEKNSHLKFTKGLLADGLGGFLK